MQTTAPDSVEQGASRQTAYTPALSPLHWNEYKGGWVGDVNSSSSEKVDIKCSLRSLQVVSPTLSALNGPSQAQVTYEELPGIDRQVEVEQSAKVPTQKLRPSIIAEKAGVTETSAGKIDLTIFAVPKGSDNEPK